VKGMPATATLASSFSAQRQGPGRRRAPRSPFVAELSGSNCEQELLVDGLKVSPHVTQVWFQGAMLYAGHSPLG
jgi:hypothetical protein